MDQASRVAVLETAIREIIHELLEMSVTPHVRELRAKTVTYGRVIKQWSMHPPTEAQRAAMHECVMELHEKVRLAWQDAGPASRGSRGNASLRGASSAPLGSEGIDEQTWEELLAEGTGVRRRTAKTSIPPSDSRAGSPVSTSSTRGASSHAPPTSPTSASSPSPAWPSPSSEAPNAPSASSTNPSAPGAGAPTAPPLSRTRGAKREEEGDAPDPLLRSRRTRG